MYAESTSAMTRSESRPAEFTMSRTVAESTKSLPKDGIVGLPVRELYAKSCGVCLACTYVLSINCIASAESKNGASAILSNTYAESTVSVILFTIVTVTLLSVSIAVAIYVESITTFTDVESR